MAASLPIFVRFLRWNRRLHEFPVLVTAILLLWVQMLLVDTEAFRNLLEKWSAERSEQTIVSGDRYDAEHPEWAINAPLATWIDFDGYAVQAIRNGEVPGTDGAKKRKPLQTSQEDLATLLGWIRGALPKPKIVFLDMTPLSGAPSVEKGALINELRRWNDPSAPLLAIYAGAVCAEHVGDDEPQNLLSDTAYDQIVSPTSRGQYAGGNRIVWACPRYLDTNSFFWTCVSATDGGDSHTVALPSPGWLAINARDVGGQNFINKTSTELGAATKACKGDERQITLPGYATVIPKLNHVRMNFDPIGKVQKRPDGRPLIQRIPVGNILSDIANHSTADVSDHIVVIGSSDSTHGPTDRVPTSLGSVAGPKMVIADMRAAWVNGMPKPSAWWASGVMATAFALVGYMLLWMARYVRSLVATPDLPNRHIMLILTNAHLIAIIYIPLCIWFAIGVDRTLVGLDFVKIGLSVIMVELMFVLVGISEELGGGHAADKSSDIGAGSNIDDGGNQASAALGVHDI